MGYNVHQKLIDNIAAIRIALEWKEGDKLSDAQVEALQKYAGFGGIKAVLYPNASKDEWISQNATEADLKLYTDIIELHNLLQQHFNEKEYKQVIDSIKNSVLTAFYTPSIVPQTLYNVLKEQGINPKSIYEPSSGAGIFITEAAKHFEGIQNITAVEKDILSGRVLTAMSSSIPVPVSVQIKAFEHTSEEENGKYDLIVSNMPFGNFRVDDRSLPPQLTGKIHNYFFAKGLDKIKEGGILAYITSDAFLNTPSNKQAREFLFNSADLISINVMPDNLMKDTGNTEAPSHLLIVQKNTSKLRLRNDERIIVDTIEKENEFGTYTINDYISRHPEIILGDEIKPGKDQYGKAHQTVWQHNDINAIAESLALTLNEGINNRLNKTAFAQTIIKDVISAEKKLTFLPMPQTKTANPSVQLGLFDIEPATNISRAMAYINELDETVVQKQTARILNSIKTADHSEHEVFVLIAAKSTAFKQYVYKLYSNANEIDFPVNWMSATAIGNEFNSLSQKLKQYNHQFFSGC